MEGGGGAVTSMNSARSSASVAVWSGWAETAASAGLMAFLRPFASFLFAGLVGVGVVMADFWMSGLERQSRKVE